MVNIKIKRNNLVANHVKMENIKIRMVKLVAEILIVCCTNYERVESVVIVVTVGVPLHQTPRVKQGRRLGAGLIHKLTLDRCMI